MSVLSSSSEEATVSTYKLGLIAPIITFLAVGLSHLVSWEIPRWGIVLLIGCVGIGLLLQCIPQYSRLWEAAPNSPRATLKQSIAVARIFVMVSLVVLPVVVLTTVKPILDQLPNEIERYVSERTAPRTHARQTHKYLVFTPDEARDLEPKLYAGKFVAAGTSGTQSAPTTTGSAAIPVARQVTGKLYDLQTTDLLAELVKQDVVPAIYQVVGIALVLTALFTAAIFFMEIFGGVLWELQRRPTTPES